MCDDLLQDGSWEGGALRQALVFLQDGERLVPRIELLLSDLAERLRQGIVTLVIRADKEIRKSGLLREAGNSLYCSDSTPHHSF